MLEHGTNLIIKNGRIFCTILEDKNMTVPELKSLIRDQGISEIEDVEVGIIEENGKIHCIRKSKNDL